jgi:hypothetical protein
MDRRFGGFVEVVFDIILLAELRRMASLQAAVLTSSDIGFDAKVRGVALFSRVKAS